MLRLAIPNLSNVWQITLKDTSLISVTGLVEIMRQSYIAAGSHKRPIIVLFFCSSFISVADIFKYEVDKQIRRKV